MCSVGRHLYPSGALRQEGEGMDEEILGIEIQVLSQR